MSFTPAQLWEFSERLLLRQKSLYDKWLESGRITAQQAEMEIEMLTEITKAMRDRAQGDLDL